MRRTQNNQWPIEQVDRVTKSAKTQAQERGKESTCERDYEGETRRNQELRQTDAEFANWV